MESNIWKLRQKTENKTGRVIQTTFRNIYQHLVNPSREFNLGQILWRKMEDKKQRRIVHDLGQPK